MKLVPNPLSLTVLVVVALIAIRTDSPAAENRILLDDGIKARLIALTPLRRNGISADAFDGRPVLVTFFASW